MQYFYCWCFMICCAIHYLKLCWARNQPRPRSFGFQKLDRNLLNIPFHPQYRKRGDTIFQYLDNLDYLYYANVSIGTPPQPLRLHFDTGSSDTWVESTISTLCLNPGNLCANTGTFDKDSSSTYIRVSSDFQICYVDGDCASGDYGSDVFHLGKDISVTGLQFGIGLNSTSTEGVMGIGLSQNQVLVQSSGRAPYKGLTDLMVDQNLIKSRVYSLWLNSLQSHTGVILFGGIDTAKFIGSLTTLPIHKQYSNKAAREFLITLTSVSLTNNRGTSLRLTQTTFAIPVLLDTGSSYNYLPSNLAKSLAKQVGAQWADKSAVPILPCDVRNYNGTVEFEFSGQTIIVPLNQLVVDAYTKGGSRGYFSDGSPICYFGIMDAGENSYVLGDTFLRSAYVVYDIDNEEISLGQTYCNATESHIIEIGLGVSVVPFDSGPRSIATELRAGVATSFLL